MTGCDCCLSREFHVDAGWFVGMEWPFNDCQFIRGNEVCCPCVREVHARHRYRIPLSGRRPGASLKGKHVIPYTGHPGSCLCRDFLPGRCRHHATRLDRDVPAGYPRFDKCSSRCFQCRLAPSVEVDTQARLCPLSLALMKSSKSNGSGGPLSMPS